MPLGQHTQRAVRWTAVPRTVAGPDDKVHFVPPVVAEPVKSNVDERVRRVAVTTFASATALIARIRRPTRLAGPNSRLCLPLRHVYDGGNWSSRWCRRGRRDRGEDQSHARNAPSVLWTTKWLLPVGPYVTQQGVTERSRRPVCCLWTADWDVHDPRCILYLISRVAVVSQAVQMI
jgi:hypothetical protein